MDAEDYLSGISGTYVELFPEMAKSEYRNLWIDAATPLVGEDNAESATDMLLGMCMAEPYGEEAVEKYAADPDSTAFNCYFLGGVEKFVMNGDTITGLDAQGQEVFAHTYQKLDVDNENSFLFYQSEDADSGEFTYFAFAPDTMETTYHLEFRYAAVSYTHLRDVYKRQMQRISTTCRAGMKEIMLIGMLPPSQRTMIRQLWKMSLNFSSRKICLRQNKRHMRTRSCQAVRMAILR